MLSTPEHFPFKMVIRCGEIDDTEMSRKLRKVSINTDDYDAEDIIPYFSTCFQVSLLGGR